MITGIQLHNFKCFEESPVFEFSKLNLLTGINGRGKSTLLQSLLLLSQSLRNNPNYMKLIINGDFIELGNFDDVKNSETPRGENIKFHLKFSHSNLNAIVEEAIFSFVENESNSLIANCIELAIKIFDKDIRYMDAHISSIDDFGETLLDINILKNLLISIIYIAADRIGPTKFIEKTYLPDIISVSPKGENVINILASDNLPLVHDYLYRGNDSKKVIQQTEEWLGYILEGAKIEIKGKDKDSSILYMLLNNNKKNNAYNYKPANMGFGYSYILPLVVAGLIANRHNTIIIENPEAHLHPRAQSRLTEFFARVASTGVQVFIESHSEHILNGLRVCALNPEIDIKNTDLSILYFNEGFEPEKLVVDEKGKIANWPEGFFDQQEIDLSNIFKYSR